MRKIICCALALLLMMGAAVVPAAAAEKVGFYDFQTVDGVAITAMDEKGPVTDGSDRMEVVYSKATSGCNYIVCLVEGASLDVLKTDTKKVYYINEENKASSTSVTFDVVPMLPTKDMDMTLFITSDDGKANVSVSMKYGAGGSAASISGTAVSWNNKADAEFMLYDSSADDAAIRKAWQAGTHASAALYTGNGGTVTASGKNYNQTFTFEGVSEGTYKLAIFKPGKYVPKIVNVTIGGSVSDLGEFTLWLYGDVNGDGKVNGTDATQIQRYYANKTPNALATGTAEVIADKKLAADVNIDAKINGTDATQIQRSYANKTPNAFDKLK